jgi:hypothetical protein
MDEVTDAEFSLRRALFYAPPPQVRASVSVCGGATEDTWDANSEHQ